MDARHDLVALASLLTEGKARAAFPEMARALTRLCCAAGSSTAGDGCSHMQASYPSER
jgi:hypothetical protein